MVENSKALKVGIGGFGAIGKKVAQALDAGIPNLELAAVSARNVEKATSYMEQNYSRSYPVMPLGSLAGVSDVVIECCPAEHLKDVVLPTLEAGKKVIVISVGALLENNSLVEIAAETGGKIMVPSGALLGLDAVHAAGQGEIFSVDMVTRKPPVGLNGAPYLKDKGLDVEGITEPLLLFKGTAAGAITGFPANLNVAVALGLSGVGPENTQLEVWADPGVVRNTHTIKVDSDSARLTMTIENIPSEENPKTGKITPLSIISTLKKMTEPVVIGA